jgi:hypothetical protein
MRLSKLSTDDALDAVNSTDASSSKVSSFSSKSPKLATSSSSLSGFPTDSFPQVQDSRAVFRTNADPNSAVPSSQWGTIQEIYRAYMVKQNQNLQAVRQAATQQAIAILYKDTPLAASQPHLSSNAAVVAAVTLAANAAQLQAEARAQVHFFQLHSALLPVQIQAWLHQQVQMRLLLAQQQQSQFFTFKQQHDGTAAAVSVPSSPLAPASTDLEPAQLCSRAERLVISIEADSLHQDLSLPKSLCASSSSSFSSLPLVAGAILGTTTPALSSYPLPATTSESCLLSQKSATQESEDELEITSTLTDAMPSPDLVLDSSRLDLVSVVLPVEPQAVSAAATPSSFQVLPPTYPDAPVTRSVSPLPSSSFTSAHLVVSSPFPGPLAATMPVVSDSASISISTAVEFPLAASRSS